MLGSTRVRQRKHLDDDVLLEVRRQLIAPTAKKLAGVRATLAKAEEKNSDHWQNLSKLSEMQCKKLRKQSQILDTPSTQKEFKDKLMSTDDRFPTATYGHALQEALENGRSDFYYSWSKNFMV